MDTTIGDITRLLNEAGDGHETAAEELWSIAQAEIRNQAQRLVARERAGDDLQPTMLVNEVWIRMNQGKSPAFANREQFYGATWRVMRQILIDFARSRDSLKRGGEFKRMDLDLAQDGLVHLDSLGDETGVLVETLDQLREHDLDAFNVFWGRFVLGRTKQQIADLLDMDMKSVQGNWSYARAWLRIELKNFRGTSS
ncbi:MAG: ECF-type sigma factor [Phycisphaerales bacterium]|nr:ECF-type sigma factor [Phycisphaerales bacterium]